MINDNESKETQFPACHLTACCKRILRTLKRNNSIDIKKKKKNYWTNKIAIYLFMKDLG